MQKNIIRIGLALAGCILLAAGCIQRSSLDSDGTPIGFSAGSAMLRDDDTKSGTLKTGPQFDPGDRISVYGWHAGPRQLVFDDQLVEYEGAGQWTYSPVRSWEWQGAGDSYDFLAIHRYQTADPHPSAVVSPRLIVSQLYHVSDNYDLMMAGVRRSYGEDSRNRAVALNFQHMCSAVRIIVYNDSEEADFTLNAYAFKNIAFQATARAQINDGDVSFDWAGAQRVAATEVGGASAIGQTLAHGSASPGYTSPFDLMIPMNLDDELGAGTGHWPSLVLRFTQDGESLEEEREVNLKDIFRLGANEEETQEPLLRWERGAVYTYKIHVRLDGGIVVHVETTDWDVVEAETPGLLI